MAYDRDLAERVRELITLRSDVTERKMFGGIAWMVGGNMACGVLGDELIVRLDPEDAERALAEPHTRPFDFTGRPMRNMAMVAPGALRPTTTSRDGWTRAPVLPPHCRRSSRIGSAS